MHMQPIYHVDYPGECYPVAEDLCRQGFYLLSASSLTRHAIEFVSQAVRACRQNI